jgi:hypothetical protein
MRQVDLVCCDELSIALKGAEGKEIAMQADVIKGAQVMRVVGHAVAGSNSPAR